MKTVKSEPSYIRIDTVLDWHVTQDTTSKHFIADCDWLHITLSSDTLDELISIIPESLELLLTDLIKEGDIQTFFDKHNLVWVENHHAESEGIDIVFSWSIIFSRKTRGHVE